MTVRRVGWETAIALGLGLLAAIAVTWPLVTKLGHIGHDPFDPRFQAWTIDWVQHKLGSPGSLFDANIFAPEPHTLAYSDSLLGIAIPLLPLRWLGVSPIGQLNIGLLLGFATSAAAGYLFGRIVTRSIAVGAITGAAFAFGPFGSVSSGALHAAAHAGVGVAAAAAWWLAERAGQRPTLRPLLAPAALLAGAIIWQASVSFYPGAYAFGAAAVVLLVRWRALGGRGWRWAVGAFAVAGLCTLALAIPYLQVRDEQPGFHRTLADLPALSADFGATDPRLSVWGSLLGKGTDWPIYGEPAFPGAVLLVLAPIGAVAGWRERGSRRQAAVVGGALSVAGATLALGAGPTGWRRYMPYRLLFDYVPGWEALRATGRAWVVGLLGVGVLAGLGALAIARWSARRFRRRGPTAVAIVATLAVVAILVEGYAPWTGRPDIRVTAVDERLAQLARIPGDQGGVLYLPALESGSTAAALSGFRQAENVYGTTAHHLRTPNGYSGYFPPSWVKLSRQMRSLPDAQAVNRLRALGVRYVVVREWARGGAWDTLLDPRRAAPLRLVGRYGGDLLYEVPRAQGDGSQ
ncbi:MAG: hypothetical protein ACHQDE_00255 [Acidimicrobiia bacterium]